MYGHLRGGRAARRPHPVAVVLWLAVAVPSLLQLVRPQIYAALARDLVQIGHGEWWRLLTPVLVQDGGLAGTAYNLVTLALTAPAATALWRPLRAVAVFVAGALVFNLPATYVWHDAGGGNSGGHVLPRHLHARGPGRREPRAPSTDVGTGGRRLRNLSARPG